MKITISFQEPETDQAGAAVYELRRLFPSVRIRTDRKEPYRHTYLTTKEPRGNLEETESGPGKDGCRTSQNLTFCTGKRK